ncbi:hypothetical protein PSPO01_06919 [Paraphaeosphaeria sporulosa]
MVPAQAFARIGSKQIQVGMPGARARLRLVTAPNCARAACSSHPHMPLVTGGPSNFCPSPTSAMKRPFTTLHSTHRLIVGRLAGPEWLPSLVSQQTARNVSAQRTRSVHDPRVSSTSTNRRMANPLPQLSPPGLLAAALP